jgi:hypothetical protein
LAACQGAPRPSPGESSALPPTLHGLTLVRSVSGEDARDLIAQLHPGPLAPAASEVGFYAAGPERAVLYVTRFPSADLAQAQLDRMAATIGHGRGGFGHHTEATVGDIVVHRALGQGRAHFFFTRNSEVVWLAADDAVARMALAALLGLSVDSLPGS